MFWFFFGMVRHSRPFENRTGLMSAILQPSYKKRQPPVLLNLCHGKGWTLCWGFGGVALSYFLSSNLLGCGPALFPRCRKMKQLGKSFNFYSDVLFWLITNWCYHSVHVFETSSLLLQYWKNWWHLWTAPTLKLYFWGIGERGSSVHPKNKDLNFFSERRNRSFVEMSDRHWRIRASDVV